MNALLSTLSSAGDLALVVLGFSLIIVIHELGHFVAARWAGIRVLAFAVGFGPALVSFRRGLGWRRGSSEAAYKALTPPPSGRGPGGGFASSPDLATANNPSPTEYRLNLLPFGGYVKMLGQDDLDPAARSDQPDSYQNCKPWRRTIVISAGVIANIITAAILFIVVFMAGLLTEPARVGAVEPGSPAATAIATNAAQLGITTPGLQSGDKIIAINGDEPLSFNDLVLASAMARRGSTLHFDAQRPGVNGILHFPVIPTEDRATHMLYIGVLPAASNIIGDPKRPEDRERFKHIMADRGMPGLEAGMTLITINGRPAASAYDLANATVGPRAQPLNAVFADRAGKSVPIVIPTRPRMMRDKFIVEPDRALETRHLLGLMPVLAVEDVPVDQGGRKSGLKPGDVFTRIGAAEWPSVPAGIAEIRAARGSTVRITVTRRDDSGKWIDKDLGHVRVNSEGKVGFSLGDSSALGPWVGSAIAKTGQSWTPPKIPAGARIVAVDGTPVASLQELRERLFTASLGEKIASAAPTSPDSPLSVTLTIESPLAAADGTRATEQVQWVLSDTDTRALAAAPWEPALDSSAFEPERFLLKASGPVQAINMGLRETKRVMMTTYVTLARLFQGSIKVEHLKGPVGIAHVGTILAERGFIWLLFFMALISVNLAVINFLPIPIADGGHFVFLLYEQITGKPVSAAVQNIAAIAGLILLATVFLIVTYHDISNLFRG